MSHPAPPLTLPPRGLYAHRDRTRVFADVRLEDGSIPLCIQTTWQWTDSRHVHTTDVTSESDCGGAAETQAQSRETLDLSFHLKDGRKVACTGLAIPWTSGVDIIVHANITNGGVAECTTEVLREPGAIHFM